VPVDCGPDWDWDVIEHAVARGPHRSALDPENAATVQDNVQYQVDAVQRLRPKKLMVSPMAVVPQKNRRGRIILDLSFPVYPVCIRKHAQPDPLQASVNNTIKQLVAPEAPVKEIGNVFRRLLHFIDSVYPDEIVIISKIDLSDGVKELIPNNDH
jgi:hypothetical protein